ncbi:hypothetical protein D5086_019679 [Populus alba]|uniref:Uncharacterized protein n=1 Tax=Populus alba TaxID=43335 RepID=A0ACC4BHZ5_POPAL
MLTLVRSLKLKSAKPETALLAYEKIRLKEGLLGIDRFSFPPLLKAASRASGLNEGKEIHGVATKLGFDKDPFVQTGLVAMISGYSRVGRVEDARLIFDQMEEKDLVCWSAMISGYAESDKPQEALNLFSEMQVFGIKPDQIHGENELGEFAAKQVLELEPDHDGALVQLSNIYAKDRRWQDVGELRNLMKQRGISKERGCSWIELNNQVYGMEIIVRDRTRFHHYKAGVCSCNDYW